MPHRRRCWVFKRQLIARTYSINLNLDKSPIIVMKSILESGSNSLIEQSQNCSVFQFMKRRLEAPQPSICEENMMTYELKFKSTLWSREMAQSNELRLFCLSEGKSCRFDSNHWNQTSAQTTSTRDSLHCTTLPGFQRINYTLETATIDL